MKVIDDIMGSGKTNHIIKMMGEADINDRFIYVTPFLREVVRVKTSVKNRTFTEPKHIGFGKLKSLKDLIIKGKNIATTHSLLKYIDQPCIDLIKASGYTLILDEVLEVIMHIPITKYDIEILIDKGYVYIEDDGHVVINKEREYVGKLDEFLQIVNTGRVLYDNSNFFLWCFPPEVFDAFTESYVATHNIDGSLMKPYFDLYNIKFDKYSISDDGLTKYTKANVSHFKSLINIFEGNNLNAVGDENGSFSSTWYEKRTQKNDLVRKLKNNIANYYRHIAKATCNDFMWTTFKSHQNILKGNGFRNDSCFCVHNARATNEYRHKKNLAYLVNRFYNPYIIRYFNNKGISISNDEYALNELLQWVFRSRVREGQKINLYIPSKRMRSLLVNWLN